MARFDPVCSWEWPMSPTFFFGRWFLLVTSIYVKAGRGLRRCGSTGATVTT